MQNEKILLLGIITYFKSFLEIIYKYIIYVLISQKYIIYHNKKPIKIKNNLDNNLIFGTHLINYINKIKKNIIKIL